MELYGDVQDGVSLLTYQFGMREWYVMHVRGRALYSVLQGRKNGAKARNT